MRLKSLTEQINQTSNAENIIPYLSKFINTIQKEVLEDLTPQCNLDTYLSLTHEVLEYTQSSKDLKVVPTQQAQLTNIIAALTQLKYLIENSPELLDDEVLEYLNEEMDITHFTFTYVAEILEDLSKQSAKLTTKETLNVVSLVDTLTTLAEGIVVGYTTPIDLEVLDNLPDSKANALYQGVKSLYAIYTTGSYTDTTISNLETLILGLDNFTLSYSQVYKDALHHMFKDWGGLV